MGTSSPPQGADDVVLWLVGVTLLFYAVRFIASWLEVLTPKSWSRKPPRGRRPWMRQKGQPYPKPEPEPESLPATTANGPDSFGSMPVLSRDQRLLQQAMFAASQDSDIDGPFDDQVSYQAGRYPEPGVSHMSLNGIDVEMNDERREELAVWGTVDGVPIEDFDDWSDWA